jgi:serine phosphatase RsbU (regulator of sigma subunit)
MGSQSEYTKIQSIENLLFRVDPLNNLAYQIRYSQPSGSLQYASEALDIARKENYPVGAAISLMHIAFAKFLMSGDYPILQTLVNAHKILDEAQKIPELPIVLNYLGNVYDSYGDFQKGIEFCHLALKLAHDNGLKEVEADTLSTLGIIFSRIADYQNSIKNLLQSLELRKELDNKPAMASSLNLIARSYSLNNENEKGEEYYAQAIELRKSINDNNALPWSYLGLASLFEKQKRFTEAIEYYLKSIELNKQNNDKRCNLQCNLGMGKIFIETGQAREAIEYLNKSLDVAKELNAKPILFEIYKAFSDYYEKEGNTSEAYKYYKLYHALKEDVLNTQLTNKLKNQQISFEVEKVQKEAEIYQLRNVELKQAFDEIAGKNKLILESISYARNIQSAVLPPEKLLKAILPEHFVLNLPKDIVSGDFLFALKVDKKLYVAVVDCTGHGVPGAFMSMLGFSFLSEIVQSKPHWQANEILAELRRKIITALRQDPDKNNLSKDGMDLSFCVIDKKQGNIQYAGAFNSAYIVKAGVLEELKADRMPIGISYDIEAPFTNKEMAIEKGMCIYMFSDGYSDQFGGPRNKKFMSGNFRTLLESVASSPMKDQKDTLEKNILDWRGENEQTDDILVLGIRF